MRILSKLLFQSAKQPSLLFCQKPTSSSLVKSLFTVSRAYHHSLSSPSLSTGVLLVCSKNSVRFSSTQAKTSFTPPQSVFSNISVSNKPIDFFNFKNYSTAATATATTTATTTTTTTTSEANNNSNNEKNQEKDNHQEKKVPRVVGFWLLGISGMVFATVVMGGITRLTESGLSMVTWHPVHERPPSNQADWEAEFELYKQFPEYKVINKHMTLEEFKQIWYMEYSHRMFGRAVGAAFAIPAIIFAARGYFTKQLKKRVLAIGSLIGFQGLLGWYMVKSGLDENLLQDKAVPRVSQYRLSAHLGSAFLIYALTLWQGLNLIDRHLPFQTGDKRVKTLRKFATGVVHLVFVTALSGAFVAGLDAGLVYNSFPKMADKWIPDDLFTLKPLIKNFFENVTTVQFDHRILGTSTFAAITGIWLYAKKVQLPTRAKAAVNALIAMATLQVTLGISTLLLLVPTPLAASHQAGSLTLLTIAIYFLHTLRKAAVIIVK